MRDQLVRVLRMLVLPAALLAYACLLVPAVWSGAAANAGRWLPGLLAAALLALLWQLRGAVAGIVLNVALVLATGPHLRSGHDAASTALSALLAAAPPLLVAWLARRLAHDAALTALLREEEQRREEREAATRAGEARFRSLLQNATDLILVLDAAGACRYVSPSVEHLLGYAAEALIGRSFLMGVHPDDTARVLHQHLEVLATQVTSPATEFRYRDADGDWHTLEASLTNLLREPSVAGIVVNARDVTSRAREQERVAHLAFHDALTGLPNRALLLDRLTQTLARQARGGGSVAVLYLDLDHFKQVNDTLGHAAGDALLVEVAARLQSCIRPGDTVARLGGDEFALILEDVDDTDLAIRTAERLLARLTEPLILEGAALQVGTSIGIALSERGDSAPDVLLRQADTALYRAKAAGRGRFRIYEQSMQMEGAA